jgi:predicted outer membrane repeat protein
MHMTKTGSQGRNYRGGGARWAVRACAAGAAVAAVAATGGATAMAAPATVTIPVACQASSLADAINYAPANAILVLHAGCDYYLPGSLPEVTSNLTIEGSGDSLTPYHNDHFTALKVSGAQLTISHLTFSGFFTGNDEAPGALINDGGTVTITTSRFIDNTGGDDGGAILNKDGGSLSVSGTAFLGDASGYDNCLVVTHAVKPAKCDVDGYGGAISNENDSVATLTSDSFLGNSAVDYGGAIYIGGGTVTVRGTGTSASAATAFTGNTAREDDGGAIYNESGTLIVSYATFSHNSSDDYGGAIEDDDNTSTVAGSSFTNNDSEYGGAVEADANLNLTGDTFMGNHAYDGGAIYVYSGATSLDKTVVTGNRAEYEGGGIYRRSGTVSLTNMSLVVGNQPDNCYGFFC